MLARASMGAPAKGSWGSYQAWWAGGNRKQGLMRLGLRYDLDFPELFRLKQVQAFLVGAAWPGAYAGLLEVLARAAENQAYLFLASRADTGSPTLFIAPNGRVLGRREEEGPLLAEPDWGFLEAYREKCPILRHRREEAYRVR